MKIAISVGGAARWLLFGIVCVAVLYPVSWLVLASFWSGRPGGPGELTIAHYVEMVGDPETWQLLLTSLVLSGSKSILACVIGVFLAWLVARTDVPFRRVIEFTAPMPFLVPGLVTTMGWAILANPTNGALNVGLRAVLGGTEGPINIYSLAGIAFVMTLSSASFVYLMMLGAMRNMDVSLEESGRMSGAGKVQTFRTVTLPLLRPALAGTALLTFMSGLEAFETPVILGTPAGVSVFTSQIYHNLRWQVPANYGGAMTLSMLLTGVMLLAILIQWRLLGRRSYMTITGRGYRAQQVSLGRWRWPAFGLYAIYFAVAVVLPIGLIMVTSFFRVFGYYSSDTLTVQNYTAIFDNRAFGRALANSLILSVGGGFITIVVCGMIAYVVVRTKFALRKVLEVIAMLPWALPGIVLSLAMLWAYIRLPIPIYGSVLLLLVAYITHGLPLGLRIMSGVFSQVGQELEESARMAGASWRRSFVDIVIALVRPAFVAGWVVLGTTFMKSVSIAAMLYGAGSEVLPMLSLRAWEDGMGGQAAAVATLMMVILLAFLLLDILFRVWARSRQAALRAAKPTGEAAVILSPSSPG